MVSQPLHVRRQLQQVSRNLSVTQRNRLKFFAMSRYCWFSKGLFIFCCIYLHFHAVTVDGRRYDSCSTPDGREGLCVAKRYCREATSQSLVPCGGSDRYCCPIKPTHRTADATQVTPSPTRTLIDTGRPRPRPVTDNNYPRPSYESDQSRTPIRNSHQEPSRTRGDSSSDSSSSRPTYYEAPRKPSRTHSPVESSKSRSDTHYDRNGQPSRSDNGARKSTSSYDIPVRDLPSKTVGRPTYEDDPPTRPRPTGTVRFEDEPMVYAIRPTKVVREETPGYASSDSSNNHKRRPLLSPEPRREISSTHRPREVHQPPSSRPREVKPSRRPEIPHSSKDETDPPRRSPPKPSRTVPETSGSSRAPVRFPHDFIPQQPQVPDCGVKPYDLFIAGGEVSDAHEWPWMTAIFRRYQSSRPKTFLCGGSLINTKYVLTAAHCFVNNYVILPSSSFVVRLGSHSLNSGEEYTVSDLIPHFNHSGGDFFNDIALVRLASEVYINDKIAPICLPFPDMMNDDFVGRMAVVAGWGDTTFRTEGSRVLQHVSVPIVSSEECSAAYTRVRGAAFLARGSDHVICAGLREGGKDACLGDSGGPLMLKTSDDRWSIIGVVSLGYKCAEPGYPGVYTRVTHYMSWIRGNMKRY
ncbi:clotting factor B [Caerostris darwini]|uniref:Clotting factor B n=1 Tax=Caerostris darwini TaxID=1538125 RepID=A0AAV4Q1K2_9ARAC|nr:clotting factor B [Caerostris darwini]